MNSITVLALCIRLNEENHGSVSLVEAQIYQGQLSKGKYVTYQDHFRSNAVGSGGFICLEFGNVAVGFQFAFENSKA